MADKGGVFLNISSLLSSDFGSGVLKLVAPKIFKPKARTGRPRKVSIENRIASLVLIGKLLMVWLCISALRGQGKLSREQGVALLAYSAQHIAEIDIVNTFPSSPTWCIKQGLLVMGYAESQIPALTWDDLMAVMQGYAGLLTEASYRQNLVKQLMDSGVPPETANLIYAIPLEHLEALLSQARQQASGGEVKK